MKKNQMLRINEILQERGVSNKDFAKSLGVTPGTVSNIMNGNHFPRPELLKKIADVADVDIRELFIPTKEKTKATNEETLYINRDGKFVAIGRIMKQSLEINLKKN